MPVLLHKDRREARAHGDMTETKATQQNRSSIIQNAGTNQTKPHDKFPRRYLLQRTMQPPSGIVVLVPKSTTEGINHLLI